ncbi:MAG: hypothetical protein KBA11_05925 [Sedimentibacter sp.]|jgi:hypothetical protein|nr:hypothetical protein [Sedimentibacter sp.]
MIVKKKKEMDSNGIVNGVSRKEALEMAETIFMQHGYSIGIRSLNIKAVAGYVSREVMNGEGSGLNNLATAVTRNKGVMCLIGDWNAWATGARDKIKMCGAWDIEAIQCGKVPKVLFENNIGSGLVYITSSDATPYEVMVWFSGWVVYMVV